MFIFFIPVLDLIVQLGLYKVFDIRQAMSQCAGRKFLIGAEGGE